MRRREKFIIASVILSLGLVGVQYSSLDWKYFAVAALMLVSYFVSAWALSDDLQKHEWFTVVPLPAMYAGAVSLFYFLLPQHPFTRISVLVMFGVGMYGLYLTSNIYSVAKGRNIQLLYAAHTIGLFFTLLTSLLFTNAIFSVRLPFYGNALLIGLVHFPLILMSLWSVRLEEFISRELVVYTSLFTLILVEFAILFSFIPMPIWNISLLFMAILYLGLGVLHSFLRGRLFKNTMNEYSLVAVFIATLFLLLFPMK